MFRCSVSLTIEDTWATSQPVTIEDRKARSRSVWSASARPSRKRNWAYAVRSTSRRVIRPLAKNGREKAVADEVAMIVLSRSKKAAVLAMCTPLVSPSRVAAGVHTNPARRRRPQPGWAAATGREVRRAACRQSTDGGAMAREVTVVGAAGGVGASTLAALLARRRAADGARVALVDLDPGRGGIEVLLGIEAQAGARWSDLAQVRGTLAGGDLDGLLPRWHGVDVLSTDRHDTTVDGEALAAVWAGLLASGRTVVADLPGSALVTGATGVTGAIGAHPALAGGVLLLTGQDVL